MLYTALQTQENHQWSQILWRLKCPLAQRHWWKQMELVHFAALSPDVDSLGARKARKCTENVILPQHYYTGSSALAQHSILTVSIWRHSVPLLSYLNFGSVCPRQLPKAEIRVDKPSMATRLSVRCARTVAGGTTERLEIILEEAKVCSTTQPSSPRCASEHIGTEEQLCWPRQKLWQWSATDAERRVKKESRQVLALLLNILPASGLPKSEVFTLYFIVFD